MTYDPNPPPPLQYATPAPQPRAPRRHLFGWVLFLGLAVMLFLLLNRRSTATSNIRQVPLSEFTTRLERNEVTRIVVESDALTGDYLPANAKAAGSLPQPFRTPLPPATGESWPFLQWLLEHRGTAEVTVRNQSSLVVNILLPIIPWLLIFAFIWFFVFRQLRKSAAGQPATIITGPGRWVPDLPVKSD